MGEFRYAPGDLVAVADWPVCVVIETALTDELVVPLLGALRTAPNAAAAFDSLASHGLSRLPGFGIMEVGTDAVRLLLRGGVKAMVDADTLLSGTGLVSEHTVPVDASVVLFTDVAAVAGPRMVPLQTGVVPVSTVAHDGGGTAVPTLENNPVVASAPDGDAADSPVSPPTTAGSDTADGDSDATPFTPSAEPMPPDVPAEQSEDSPVFWELFDRTVRLPEPEVDFAPEPEPLMEPAAELRSPASVAEEPAVKPIDLDLTRDPIHTSYIEDMPVVPSPAVLPPADASPGFIAEFNWNGTPSTPVSSAPPPASFPSPIPPPSLIVPPPVPTPSPVLPVVPAPAAAPEPVTHQVNPPEVSRVRRAGVPVEIPSAAFQLFPPPDPDDLISHTAPPGLVSGFPATEPPAAVPPASLAEAAVGSGVFPPPSPEELISRTIPPSLVPGFVPPEPFAAARPAQPTQLGEPPEDVEDSGHTVRRSKAQRALGHAGAPVVLAVECSKHHLNPPYADKCRVCGLSIAAQHPFEIERPPLGYLRLQNGAVIELSDGSVIFGRNPHPIIGSDDQSPNLVRIADPGKDVSGQHLEVSVGDWFVSVRDLDSTNGTEVFPAHRPPVMLRANEPMVIEPGTKVVLADVFSFIFEVEP
ncbi:MAG: hypothetical protein LBH11_05930 [Propionibacteriaceae bacterium]|jgi:hypothetical protein|nr:hypothetical protein [Propionibacteriaceae bacterium]